MTHARVAAVAVALLLAPAAHARELCRTRVIVEPETAWVGQQLAYRLQILRHVDVASVRFARDLAFPSFRAEWLPGQSPDPAIADVGDNLLVFEERRALFPARAGELAIPAARIACVSASETVEVEVPAARVVARELPRDGAPADFRGVVGAVKLQAHLARERIALGESLALAIRATGAANLWDAAEPFAGSRDLPGVDVHARPPELERDAGPHLVVQRSFAYDLVPRATGDFTIPALRVPYFDPATGRYATAETAPLHFVVEAGAAAPPPAPRAARARDDGTASIRALALLGAALFLAMLAVIAAFAIVLGRRRNRARSALRAAEPLLAEANAASARGDRAATASALVAALRAALESRLPGASALTSEELARRDEASLRAAGEALRDLDRARFGAEAGGARPLDVAAVRALIAAL